MATDSNFRKAVPPEPSKYPKCRNCKHFAYDSDDRMGRKGNLLLKKVNLRCKANQHRVTMGSVCDLHQYMYSTGGDV